MGDLNVVLWREELAHAFAVHLVGEVVSDKACVVGKINVFLCFVVN